MKPTQSMDGKMRLNIKVNFRMGLDEMVDAFCNQFCRDQDQLDESGNLAMKIESKLKLYNSKRQILRLVNFALWRDGSAYWVWSDDKTGKFANTLREQVKVMIAKKFKDLKS